MVENNIDAVNKKLKEEFFGIDEQIDEVTKSFSTWLSVREYQVRPMTVCLWGLTGTGKTALINRAIELLDLNKKKFYLKFGSKTSNINEDFEQNTCQDTIFVLDEFQYFRTKKENGDELERDENNSTNMIWELLDGGLINLYGQQMSYTYEKFQLNSSLYALRQLDSKGVMLRNGVLYHENMKQILNKLYIQQDTVTYIEEEKNEDYSEYSFRSGNRPFADGIAITKQQKKEYKLSDTEVTLRTIININWSTFYEFTLTKDIDYKFLTKVEFYSFLKNSESITDLIKFIKNVCDSKQKLEIRNYTKSLIFVLGNLDECFSTSKYLSSDLDADYFYKKTKNVTIVDIRKSLLKRFRPEQIARLGSTHIIYPSLNKKAFEEIINKELNQFECIAKQKFENKINTIRFTEQIKQLIYKEGVFPMVGARSVFSIVNEIVTDKFTSIIKTIINSKNEKINIIFDYENKKRLIKIQYFDETTKKLINEDTFKFNIKIDKLRSEKNKGKQTHRAVHEAGHAVCSIVLNKSFPEFVYSVVLDEKNSGFNIVNSDDYYYYTKSTYMNEIATLLAGYVAEKIVFGEENVSEGSSSDIQKSTTLLMRLMKDCGFMGGDYLAAYVSKSFTSTFFETSNYSLVDNNDSIERRVSSLIGEAINMATETLEEQNLLFMKISEYLSNNPKISNKKIKEFTKKYINNVEFDSLLKDKNYFYVDIFNKKLKNEE